MLYSTQMKCTIIFLSEYWFLLCEYLCEIIIKLHRKDISLELRVLLYRIFIKRKASAQTPIYFVFAPSPTSVLAVL